jgi:beta-galactosidase
VICFADRAVAAGWPGTNDSMFPPAAAAKSAINFDGRGFIINGKRVFVCAGEFQYARTPRAMWRDRLLRIKRAGYNAIQTYTFWNYHEPREGQFDFEGNRDVNAFLKLVQSMGMYAIVRIGPYVNAEWDTGGLPVWLKFKPGLLPMEDNAPFYAAVTPYFDKLFPIIVSNQINRGGCIIMVQLENENTRGSGTDLPDAYYRWYQAKALKYGLEAPYFFTGLNHNDHPAGDDPFDTSTRTSPWMSSEFWTGWFQHYGMPPERAKLLERTTWEVIAYGGAGYAHYEMAAGTNFDTWNCDEQAASYDFGSPIGQAGDFRDGYYLVKRAALFATSFQDIISNSIASEGGIGMTATNGVRLTNKQGPAGKIVFLHNRIGDQPVQVKTADGATLPAAGSFKMALNEFIPVVEGYTLAPGVQLDLGVGRILGKQIDGNMTTLVVFGNPGDHEQFNLSSPAAAKFDSRTGPIQVAASSGKAVVSVTVPDTQPADQRIQFGKTIVRFIAVSTEMANRTWFLTMPAHNYIVCGPDYVGEANIDRNGRLVLQTEQRSDTVGAQTVMEVFGPGGAIALHSVVPSNLVPGISAAPTIGKWYMASGDAPAQPSFKDASWMKCGDNPLQMGGDGDNSAYAWYRGHVNVPSAGKYEISFANAAEWISVFVNGTFQLHERVGESLWAWSPHRVSINLNAGDNLIAVLAAHYGRNKFFNYYGPLATVDSKGISGPVTVARAPSQSVELQQFKWKEDDNGTNDAAQLAAPGVNIAGADWQDCTIGTDIFNNRVGYCWVRCSIPQVAGPHRRIFFGSVDDDAVVYLNGKLIGSHQGAVTAFDFSLDNAWNDTGSNELAVLVQNESGTGGIFKEVVVEGGNPTQPIPVVSWTMHGGITPPAADDKAAWLPCDPTKAAVGSAWYMTTYNDTPPSAIGPHLILRADNHGLSQGFTWLNGHNLGRYPELSPVDGEYMPECWRLPGKNVLVYFDENGNAPGQAGVIEETAASRTGFVLETDPHTVN